MTKQMELFDRAKDGSKDNENMRCVEKGSMGVDVVRYCTDGSP